MAGSKRAAKHRHSEADERLLVEGAQRDPSCFADLYEDYFEIVLNSARMFTGTMRSSISLGSFVQGGVPFVVESFLVADWYIA